MLLFRSDYSVLTALLGLSIMFGYLEGYLPHHSVMSGILFGAAGFVLGLLEIATLALVVYLIVMTLRAAAKWYKDYLHSSRNAP